MGLKKNDIINDIVTEAEKLDLGEKDYAIYDVYQLDLKAVIQFACREIHVMTVDEAKKVALPGSR
jgi:hypothetical protein